MSDDDDDDYDGSSVVVLSCVEYILPSRGEEGGRGGRGVWPVTYRRRPRYNLKVEDSLVSNGKSLTE